MYSLLLAIIYLCFIALGLPDSLLGAAWPVMQGELSVPISYLGVLTMITSLSTILSSLFTGRLINRFGTGTVTAASIALTTLALFGYSVSPSFPVLCILAVPYGLGAGAVDASLNSYVALHYSSRHLNWLHAFWGVGITLSPSIMSYCLSLEWGWRSGFSTVFIAQLVITAVIVASIPLWKRGGVGDEEQGRNIPLMRALKMRGFVFVLLAFFISCAIEATAGLWASSYFVGRLGVLPEAAAAFASLFFLGETAGRFASGLVSSRLGDKAMIRIGLVLMALGGIVLVLSYKSVPLSLVGLLLLGFGIAPIYPSLVHMTPPAFGRDASASLMGTEMAFAYLGTTFMPSIFGAFAEGVGVFLYPAFLASFVIVLIFSSEMFFASAKNN